MSKYWLYGVLGFLLSAASWAEDMVGDVARGKAKSAPCQACHSTDGNSTNPIWPKLAGQNEAYLYKQLLEFRKGPEGLRNQPIMLGMVSSLSDQDLADLAAYYASLSMTEGKAGAATVELGKKIYFGGNLATGVSACSACHGPAGMGNALAAFPRMAGQHANYLADQLHKFKSGERRTSSGMMHDVVKNMSEEEIQAVSEFIEGLHVKPSDAKQGVK